MNENKAQFGPWLHAETHYRRRYTKKQGGYDLTKSSDNVQDTQREEGAVNPILFLLMKLQRV